MNVNCEYVEHKLADHVAGHLSDVRSREIEAHLDGCQECREFRDGIAILFVSSELEEILGMSDRALVMHEGRITGELARDALSEEAVMHLATGSRKGERGFLTVD